MAASQAKDCTVCVNTKFLLECKFCAYEVCKSCMSKYLVDSINEAECMNCHKYYDREYLIQLCGKSWYNNTYKPSRENVMFEREKTTFAESIPFVELQKDSKKLDETMRETHEKIQAYDERIRKLTNARKVLANDLVQLQNRKATNEAQIKRGQLNAPREAATKSDEEPVVAKTKFYTSCSYSGCDGIVNDDGVCIKCDLKMCKKCCAPFAEGHECDENTLATIAMLKKDTKPCPSCSTPIHKISGCYQMWCTVCHTTFHYNTGEILKEVVHNPHYVEWMTNNSFAPQPGGGGGCNLYNQISRLYANRLDKNSVLEVYRTSRHIDQVLIPEAENNVAKFSGNRGIMEHRVKFMTGSMTEKVYKQKLFMNYKQLSRWTDTRSYLELARDGLTSITVEYINNPNIESYKVKLDNLIKFLKTESDRLSSIYDNSMVYYSIDTYDDYSFTLIEGRHY